MMLRKWEDLPSEMQTPEVRVYYDILKKKKLSLFFKRIFDIVVSFTMLCILSPVFIILAIAIKIDTRGPVFYRQTRVTQYNKKFRIFKFRSMVQGADKGVDRAPEEEGLPQRLHLLQDPALQVGCSGFAKCVEAIS